jgi:hypothetical protein
LGRLLALRATELEVHHVDLGTGHTTRSWPARFVAACLPLRVAWLGPHHRSRHDADLGIGGRWLLRATDLGHAWLVEASGRTVLCDAVAADDRGDAVLSAPAADLLAFLLGHEPGQPLELTGTNRSRRPSSGRFRAPDADQPPASSRNSSVPNATSSPVRTPAPRATGEFNRRETENIS